MSDKTAKKTGLITLCPIITFGSVIGIFAGISLGALQGLLEYDFEGGYILAGVSDPILVGAIAYLSRIFYGKKTQRDKRVESLKKPTRKTLIWTASAIVSGAGAILSIIFFGIIANSSELLALILAVVLPGLFVYSEFVLISGRTQRIKEIAD